MIKMAITQETTIVKISKSHYVRIPKEIFSDEAFPFKKDKKLRMIIENGSLLII